ncbi:MULTISPECIES: acyl-CoA dehydrogenase family protein [Roseivirga]|uniref:Acyl-CoA dehydrogenase n=1 Tax=Roseivirga spongicola TaxID=333140 RepID=A0A150XH27_9BACT|nr:MULTISPECIES: acyl-CoA dehydrogenase family protein [Roseivirga]KYG78009.1 acyl-CoA dehydrogenase [Roseivirga spongicola]MBO6661172.1 acyl-CoA dehydrogenase family protein [Roseivirga sp.]MBO6908844.1 acyl-CoA dehydrogenase family protein [Roseivirga sp.]WPZ11744.1 acyl-CoA dehydrogenase family protein [Roseivirga spongicola]
MSVLTDKKSIKGGEFIVRETEANEVFIPEEFSEEQKMMAQACQDFIDTEITPRAEEIDSMKDPNLVPNIFKKAGELGLLGISVPEQYGGMGMSFNTSMLIADIIGAAGSFSTTYGAHTGIGTLPILYYGNDEQKQKYLPKLATGEWAACYCLTEPDAGSDANSGKTKAVLSEDGSHYKITGQKMWISNAGFADIFIVFAKIEDDKNLTAFIVEKGFGGITMNEEEKKMGIKGSSTRQVFFNDCEVPAENMLSERGNGFKIAVNILNIGRVKLGAGVLGGCRTVISQAANYSNERKQFGVSISSFGAIKGKLAEMATRTYVTESLDYRAGQNIEDKINDLIADGMDETKAKLKGVEQFAIECAIAKIHSSEVLDYVVDEGVQVYGGMGFSADAPMERAYRDARIARIYEGTNEINRMLMVGMLLKRAMKGEIDIYGPAMDVSKELTSVPTFSTIDKSVLFAGEKEVIKNLKKVFLMVGGKAAMALQDKIEDEQEVMMNLADILIEVYACESAMLRTEKLVSQRGEEACADQIAMTQIYMAGAIDKIISAAKEAIGSFTKGDEQKVMLMGLKRFTKMDLVNVKELRRQVADTIISKGKFPYFFG